MKLKNIEDIYELSPVQKGMLFHSLSAPGSGVYLQQFQCALGGTLDIEAFEQAWQQAVNRHPVLRTSFFWEGLDKPVQVVRQSTRIKIEIEDWSALSEAEQSVSLQQWLDSDRKRGFELTRPPLLRLTLLKLGLDSYRFIWSQHHLQLDGWSVPLLLEEVFLHYEALRRGTRVALESPRPYRDYIAWLQGQSLEEAERFWRRRLKNFNAATPLLAGRGGASPSAAANDTDGASAQHDYREMRVHLSRELTASLTEAARGQQVTLNTLVQGAWALLLSRYSGESDVVFGATVAGRPAELAGVERMLGLFINTLPVRVRVDEGERVGAWLRRIQTEGAEARQYEHSPLVEVAGWSELPRGAQLFESVLAFENFPVDATLIEQVRQKTGLEIRDFTSQERGDQPLALVVFPDRELILQMEYEHERFDDGTVRRMLGHIEQLLTAIAADCEQRVGNLPLLSDAESRQLLVEWNDKTADFPHERCLHELIEARVESAPDRVAVAYEGRQLTYRQLNERANRLARHLLGLGVGAEVRVGIMVERSLEMIVALLGVLKAGGAYVPLDPEYPAERLRFMLEDARIRVLVTQQALAERASDSSARVVCIDSEWTDISRYDGENVDSGVTPDNLAYIIYTSGSTGRPKGVLITHSSLVSYVSVISGEFGLTPDDGFAQLASASFDVAVEEIFPALVSGARVVLCRDIPYAKDFLPLIVRERLTAFELPTAFWNEWVYELSRTGERLPECVRLVVVGGEKNLPDRYGAWRRLTGGKVSLIHVYGLTETTVTSTTYQPTEENVEQDIKYPLPIGRPLPNTQIYILDAQLRPVPPGVAGELYIGGVSVARGYHNRPELTAERFVPDPFSRNGGDGGGARLYRTGDLARYLEDGNIEFLRRIDEQVKVRGYRIEPAEIEALLAEHPAVRDAVVAVREDIPGQKRLVAYVTPGAGLAVAPGGLRRVNGGKVELWPSHGEYPVYNDLLYQAMADDTLRNQGYREAVAAVVPGKVVVDVGTGAELVLARMCVEAGARKVYAIEVMEESFQQAESRVRELGLEDRITLIPGDATTIELPEPVDVCISELIGCIGGSEGAVAILNHARRWLKPGGVMIPARCLTRIAAAVLPDEVHADPAFEEMGAHYAEQVFDHVGHRDDVRLCVKNFPKDHLLSESAVFEDLDFTRWGDPVFSNQLELRIDREGRLDGFLLWVQLYPGERMAVDTLEDACAWLPMFFPAFYPGVPVHAGDMLSVEVNGSPAETGTYPNYHLRGVLRRSDGTEEPFAYDSFWKKRPSSPNALHSRLVSQEEIQVRMREGLHVSFAELRAYLGAKLPDYMVPNAFVALESLPLTANGKIDRRALPAPDMSNPAPAETRRVAGNPLEQTLAAIWAEVLGVAEVGMTDNFFELGGDSILCIQVVARANRAGLHLSPRHLFEYQTVEELASAAAEMEAAAQPAASATPAKGEKQEVAERDVPLTPIQRWFFARNFVQPHHWNQSVLLETRRPLRRALLAQVFDALVRRHAALRLRFKQESGDVWRQRLLPPEAAGVRHAPVHEVDLTLVDESARVRVLEQCCAQAQRSLNLTDGPLMRFVLFSSGARGRQRLLASAHHLITDGVSWRVLLDELQHDYEQAATGAARAPEPEAASFHTWAERLVAYAGSDELAAQESYWSAAEQAAREFRLPLDERASEMADNTEASVAELKVSLTAEETHALLREVPRAYRSRIQDALVAALGRALNRWTGRRRVAVWVEGHGREQLGTDDAGTGAAEVTGAVGWFTALYPVAVETEWDDEGAALKAAKEALRSVPDGGIGYGVWKYVREAGGNNGNNGNNNDARSGAHGGVAFNYLGQLDQAQEDSALLALASESPGPATSPLAARSFLLEINGAIADGRLQLTWNYSRHLHRRETIERVAADYLESLREIIEHCRWPDNAVATPSDFPEAKLSQEELDELAGGDGRIEDIQPLSPMQKGMLFHRLYNPESGEYVAQFVMTMRGELDEQAFEESWRQVVQRHSILRTDFISERRDQPLQIVREAVSLPWERQDWSALTSAQQEENLQAYLHNDRRRGFELTRAPLLRLLLIRTSGDAYRLVWTLAMMLLDGWSVPLLLEEVFLHYEALRRGTRVALESPRPYRDYIAWLQGQSLEEAERFWRRRLKNFTATTPFAVDHPVGSDGETAGSPGQREIRLSRELTASLTEAARGQQVTLNTLVQGAWALLLSRYSGESDVVFGATVAGRPAELAGVERMLGLFINTLPVRVRVDEGERVGAWLRRIQTEGAEARQYEHSPLVEVAGWSELPRGAQLFESLLVFDNYPFNATLAEQVRQKTGLEVSELRVLEQTNFPLSLTIMPGEQLTLVMRYERARFDEETTGRMIGHLERVLDAISSDVEQRLGDLRLLTEIEERGLLVEWNDTRVEYPQGYGVHQLFERQVERTPNTIAVAFEDERVSYRELNYRANRVAHRLMELGVGSDVRVGVMLDRSTWMVASLLGVLKAGGAYVPLDPSYPQERLAFMLEDSGARVLLTQERHAARLDGHAAQVICLDDEDEALGVLSGEKRVCARPDDLAYVIYTSGSTGKPKGVMVTHRGLVNYLSWSADTYAVGEGCGAPVHSPLGFDLTVTSLFTPLVTGRTVHLVNEEEGVDGLVKTLREGSGYSLVKITPAHLEALNQLLPPAETTGRTRALIIGGEALRGEVLEFWTQHAPETRLINEYGPTEAVVGCCVYEVPRGASLKGGVPIGRPIANTRAYVLDHQLRLVPVGVPGELYIGGDGLARGYLNRPALTAERFIPNPYSDEPGERLYRTGDVARWCASGELQYIGRNDQQVKVRGYRIELGEIEAVLGRHPRVRDCAVTAREDETGGKRLVAYVATEPGEAVESGELRAFLSGGLPEYMVPSLFVMLDELPLSPNGKVDRRALPAPDAGQLGKGQEYVAPLTPAEDLLAGIWSQVLGVERVGVTDNFFELGGHSLLATQVISRIREAFQVELPLRRLFESPTVAELARVISEERRDAPPQGYGVIKAAAREGELPLSFAQQRLWFLNQWEPSSSFYNSPSALRLTGHLDARLLRRTLHEVVRRHEVLRTSFASVAGRPVQRIDADARLTLPVVDLSALAEVDRRRVARSLAQQEARRPFDLSVVPLLRVTLLRLSAEEHVALFTMHHIVSDGWSLSVLVREVATLYAAFSEGRPSPLAELPLQYADYAVWQRDYLQGDVLERQLDYWRKHMAGAPAVLELPTDRPRPRVQTYRGSAQSFLYPADLLDGLKALSRREDATLFMTLLAAFQLMLSRYAGQEDVVVGTAVANRTRRETEDLIGFFINSLVLRTDLSGNPRFTELLRRVREVCLGAYAHQEVPFERLVEELRPERSLSHSPLFQVSFGLNNAPQDALELPGLQLGALEIEDESVRFDLTLWVAEDASGLRGRWTYRTELFDAETIKRITAHWETLLRSIVAAPDARLQSLEMLTEEERKRRETEEMLRETVTTEKLLTARRKTIKVAGDVN